MSINAAMCPKCGNQIIPYETIKPTFSNGFTSMVITTSENTMPFCVCSLKPVEPEKHDEQAWNSIFSSPLVLNKLRQLAKEVMEEHITGKTEEGGFALSKALRHDGNLDEDGEYTVSHSYGAWGFEGVILDERKRTTAILKPSQVLSLLAWLKQEESTLEQMVKEQQCTTN